MSFSDRLIHRLLIADPPPDRSPDATGQLFVNATGQPVGDPTVYGEPDWSRATEVKGLVQERSARWPQGPGAGSELVNTMIFLEFGLAVRELAQIKRIDVEPNQTYQAVFVEDAAGRGHHLQVQARRIPL